MVVYIIAAAAGIGSLIGAFFQVRLMALLWSTPVVCVLYGAAVFVAPMVKENPDAPELLRTAMLQFADISLLAPVLVAGAAGTIFASSLTRHVRAGQIQALNFDDGLIPRPTKARLTRKARNQLKARTQSLSERRPPPAPAPAYTPPVYEIDLTPAPPPVLRTPTEAAPPPLPNPPTHAPPPMNRRRQGRRRSLLSGELVFASGRRLSCTIQDLSVGGARVRVTEAWPAGELRNLLDLTNGLAHEAGFRWRAGPFAGVSFTASRTLETFAKDACPTNTAS